MPKSQPMNGTTSVTIAATSSLPVGRCSASGAGSAASTISIGWPEPFERVAHRDLAGSLLLA